MTHQISTISVLHRCRSLFVKYHILLKKYCDVYFGVTHLLCTPWLSPGCKQSAEVKLF